MVHGEQEKNTNETRLAQDKYDAIKAALPPRLEGDDKAPAIHAQATVACNLWGLDASLLPDEQRAHHDSMSYVAVKPHDHHTAVLQRRKANGATFGAIYDIVRPRSDGPAAKPLALVVEAPIRVDGAKKNDAIDMLRQPRVFAVDDKSANNKECSLKLRLDQSTVGAALSQVNDTLDAAHKVKDAVVMTRADVCQRAQRTFTIVPEGRCDTQQKQKRHSTERTNFVLKHLRAGAAKDRGFDPIYPVPQEYENIRGEATAMLTRKYTNYKGENLKGELQLVIEGFMPNCQSWHSPETRTLCKRLDSKKERHKHVFISDQTRTQYALKIADYYVSSFILTSGFEKANADTTDVVTLCGVPQAYKQALTADAKTEASYLAVEAFALALGMAQKGSFKPKNVILCTPDAKDKQFLDYAHKALERHGVTGTVIITQDFDEEIIAKLDHQRDKCPPGQTKILQHKQRVTSMMLMGSISNIGGGTANPHSAYSALEEMLNRNGLTEPACLGSAMNPWAPLHDMSTDRMMEIKMPSQMPELLSAVGTGSSPRIMELRPVSLGAARECYEGIEGKRKLFNNIFKLNTVVRQPILDPVAASLTPEYMPSAEAAHHAGSSDSIASYVSEDKKPSDSAKEGAVPSVKAAHHAVSSDSIDDPIDQDVSENKKPSDSAKAKPMPAKAVYYSRSSDSIDRDVSEDKKQSGVPSVKPRIKKAKGAKDVSHAFNVHGMKHVAFGELMEEAGLSPDGLRPMSPQGKKEVAAQGAAKRSSQDKQHDKPGPSLWQRFINFFVAFFVLIGCMKKPQQHHSTDKVGPSAEENARELTSRDQIKVLLSSATAEQQDSHKSSNRSVNRD